MNKLHAGDICTAEPRHQISIQMMTRLDQIANSLENLTGNVCAKLEPIMAQAYDKDKCGKEQLRENYPPYFHQMRMLCERMEESMSTIEDAINRTEF